MSDPAYVDYVDPAYLRYVDDEHPDEQYDHDRDEVAAYTPSVHPSQSTVIQSQTQLPAQLPTRQDVAYRFRRKDHKEAYDAVLTALSIPLRHQPRARRLSLCGAHATIWHSPSTDAVACRSYHCGLRCCPRCRETHAARTAETLARFCAATPRNRMSMITLTVQHSSLELSQQLDHLYASFRRLRQSSIWRDAMPRGLAVIEITRNHDRSEWHPHLHLLTNAPYIQHHTLRDAWTAATRGATIIDIRRVNRRAIADTQHYLTDYLTKPPDPGILASLPLLTEWIDALTHRKVLLRFGRPVLAQKPPPKPDPNDWACIGSLIGLLAAVARKNRRAVYWLSRLTQGRCIESRDIDAGKDYQSCPDTIFTLETFF